MLSFPPVSTPVACAAIACMVVLCGTVLPIPSWRCLFDWLSHRFLFRTPRDVLNLLLCAASKHPAGDGSEPPIPMVGGGTAKLEEPPEALIREAGRVAEQLK